MDTVAVQKDDIIILSSDGLWDVIKGEQLHQIVKRNANKVILSFYININFQKTQSFLIAFTRFS